MSAPTTPDKMKVSNPERILRVLQRVAEGGLAVQVRATKQSEVAVKGRAVASVLGSTSNHFMIGGISEKGRTHLAAYAEGGIQVEFVLMSTKIVFHSRIVDIDGNGIVVSIPEYLLSIERRKDARFPVTVSTRAYLHLEDWHPDLADLAMPPFFEYQRNLASQLHIGDVSVGGLSIGSRFPALCRILQKGTTVENANLLLPLQAPIPAQLEVRWVKRLRENVQDFAGGHRTTRIFKFGVQFINPSEKLQLELQRFMARLAVAEAI